MNKFIKEIIVLVLLINSWLLMASEYEEEIPVLPKKSWGELVEQLGPHTLSARALSVTDCPEVITDEKKVAGIYQHIMFNDYMWDTYKLADGNRCINLLKPEVGLLTEYEARVLLSAGQGHGFDESGMNEEVEKFVTYQDSLMDECEVDDSTNNQDSNNDNSIVFDIESANARSTPYTIEERKMIDSQSINSS